MKMINKEIKGDLIALAKNGHFDVIIHGCNCFNVMGAGIAKQIREHFPEAYLADKRSVKGSKSKLGTYTYSLGSVIVINAYTQYRPRRGAVDYEAIQQVFKKLNSAKVLYGASIGIPLIGCGLAGGNWHKVKQIINEATPDLNITLVKYN